MPNRSDIHIDKALTNISVKYMQDESNFIAGQVFPMVPVKKQSDRYFVYLREDWFRDDARERAPGTESAGGDYEIDNTPTYFCRKYAYHKDVYEEDRVNADDPLTPDEDAVAFVTDKILLNKENNWARTFFKKNVWGTDYEGAATAATGKIVYWDDYANSTPIEDMTKFATDMAEVTGKRPNTLVMGRRAYDALKNHPDFLDRVKYTQKGVVTKDLIAEMFDVERVLVANAVQNTAPKQGAMTRGLDMSFILGNHLLLCYTTNAPKLKTATAGYTFVWTGLMGSNALGGRINRFSMPMLGIGTERIEIELAYDMKVVAADMGIFVENVVHPA